MIDFSNLNKDPKLFLNEFMKKPGYLEIKTSNSLYIKKCVCLRSKCYAYETDIDGNDNKLKGICKG